MRENKPPAQSKSSSWKEELAEWRASVKGNLMADWGITFFIFSLAAVKLLKVPAEERLLKLEEINREMKMTTHQVYLGVVR